MATDSSDLMPSILAQTQAQLTAGHETTRIILENQNQSAQALKSIEDIYTQVSKDATVVKSAEQAARLTTQAAIKSRANAFGADISATADVMTELAIRRKAQSVEADASLVELQRRASVKFTDSPLDFIGNQLFGVYDARQEFRMKQGMVSRTQSEIDDLNKNIQSTVQTYKALEESVTVASADAATRLAASEANAKMHETRLRSLKNDSEAVTAAYSLGQSSLNAIYSAVGALRAEEQLALSKKHFSLSQEQFEFSKEERTLAREARQEGKDLDENIGENYNLGLASLGLEAVTGVELRQIIALFKSNNPEVFAMYRRGREVKRSGGRAIIGLSAADSILNLDQNPNAERTLPEIKTPVITVLNTARGAVNKAIGRPGGPDPKDSRAIEKALNTTVQTLLIQQFAQSDSSPDNVFNTGDLKQYLGSTEREIPPPRAIGNLSLYKKLLQPLAEAGADLSQPRFVYETVYSAVKDGKITLEEAEQLSQVYRVAHQINLAARGFHGFGISSPVYEKHLYVKLGKFGSTVDITDPNVLRRRLVGSLAVDKFGVAATVPLDYTKVFGSPGSTGKVDVPSGSANDNPNPRRR